MLISTAASATFPYIARLRRIGSISHAAKRGCEAGLIWFGSLLILASDSGGVDPERIEQVSRAREQHVAGRVELGQSPDEGGGGLEIGVLGRDHVEQIAPRVDEPFDQHVAGLAACEVARLKRPKLLLERLDVRPGDGRVPRRLVADPRGPGVRGAGPGPRLGDPRLGAAEQALAQGQPAANVIVPVVLEDSVAAGVDS